MGVVAAGMLVVILLSTLAGTAGPRARFAAGDRVAITLTVSAVATLALLALPIALTGTPFVSRGVVSLIALSVLVALAVAVVRDRLFQVGLLTRSRERIVAAREDAREAAAGPPRRARADPRRGGQAQGRPRAPGDPKRP